MSASRMLSAPVRSRTAFDLRSVGVASGAARSALASRVVTGSLHRLFRRYLSGHPLDCGVGVAGSATRLGLRQSAQAALFRLGCRGRHIRFICIKPKNTVGSDDAARAAKFAARVSLEIATKTRFAAPAYRRCWKLIDEGAEENSSARLRRNAF